MLDQVHIYLAVHVRQVLIFYDGLRCLIPLLLQLEALHGCLLRLPKVKLPGRSFQTLLDPEHLVFRLLHALLNVSLTTPLLPALRVIARVLLLEAIVALIHGQEL